MRVRVVAISSIKRAALAVCLAAAVACGGGSPTAPSPPATAPTLPAAFRLSGDPEAPGGATWTYKSTDGGVAYDLTGILLKPRGSGRFGAVIVSHGFGSNTGDYPARIAAELVTWNLVVIATNYTHAGGVPIGSPGTSADPGASSANVLRARKLVELLGALGYVDSSRVAAHGHSLGAFVTTALVAAYPGLIRVASHTAGGVIPIAIDPAIPTQAQAASITTPYQLHHGDRDTVVPLELDQLFNTTLRGRGTEADLQVYTGASHDDVALSSTMLSRVRSWYAGHGMF